MKLQSYGSDPSVLAYGAYLIEREGKRFLRVPELLVRQGHNKRTLMLRQPKTRNRWKVKLPKEAAKPSRHLRFEFEELEVLE